MRQQQQQNQTNSTMQQPDEQHLGRGSKRRATAAAAAAAAATTGSASELIGAIDQGTSSTRFLAFERGSGQLVASSQLEIKRITPREGWVEMDPNAIMSSVYATMANVHEQLMAKRRQLSAPAACAEPPAAAPDSPATAFLQQQQQGFGLLHCIGICNQRESAVVWDAKTGRPLYNVIVWMDNRTKDIVDDMIDSIPGRDFNHLKHKTGLPMSTYFSAFKLRWLIDNVPAVQAALRERRLLVGTVDSWILWNLTGKHLTDVTNASRTFLMDIETLQWDKALCKQFKVPMEILPKILASADDFGALQFGPFMGTPVTGVIGDQSAALFGHNCLQLGQTKATFGTGCFIMQNIGQGPLNGALSGVQHEAKRGLITTVGYKLKDKPACYALEGSIKIAGAALTWLRDNMQLIENYEECDQLVNDTTNSAGVFFVPALGGLYSPYWDPNAAGLFIGLSQFTRREHLVRATFDSIAFQTNDILSLMRGVTSGLMIDGGLCKSENLCQILADITGCDIVRPAMCETSALGAAMVAGCGAGIWDYEAMLANSNAPHEYACSANQNHHYPHELLHYDDNKFAHSLRSFKPAPPGKQAQQGGANGNANGNAGHNHSASANHNATKRAEDLEQQQQQPSAKHHRRSLRHRNGGRLMRNLDAGGGINDDAGGGGGGGGGELENEHENEDPIEQLSAYSSDNEEDDNSSGGHLASSDTDFELNGAALLTASESSTSNANNARLAPPEAASRGPAAAAAASAPQAVIENRASGSPCDWPAASTASATAAGAVNGVRLRPLASLLGASGSQSSGAPCSSGYSSGDNFESASTMAGARTDSPSSQATTASGATTGGPAADGRDSAAGCTEDLSSACTSVASGPSAAGAASKPATFPFNLTNYIAGHQQEQPALQLGAGAANDSDGAGASLVAPVVRQVTNQKFAETAEDVADEVHEFGGRDSFGEDGYDSSTVSFDSYDDERSQIEDLDGPAAHDDEVANGATNGRNEQLLANGNSERVEAPPLAAAASQRDVISNKLATPTAGGEATGGQHHSHQHRRQRQASCLALAKQVDVFQPYISLEHRTELVDTWRRAVTRSMQWTKVHHEEVRRIDYQRLSSLPISMYVFFSIGLVALSGCLSPLALAAK